MNRELNDAKRSAAQDSVPAALLDIHQRLLADGAAWRDDLTLGATGSTPACVEQTTPHNLLSERTGRRALMAPPPTMTRRDVRWGRRLIASAALVVVVGLLATLFASFAHGRHDTRLTSGGRNSSPTAATPANTPGPAARYVVTVVTARAVDSAFTPIDITSRFPVGSQVHLVVQIRNVAAGEKHTVSVRWFLNGSDMQVNGGPGRDSVEVTENSNVHLALLYTSTGVGMAKIYWDRPASDTSDSNSDPSLAQTISFTIERPTPSAAGAKSR
jgi:hypothetical protein